MSGPAVAIIDIGSNSIKVLVAARAEAGGLKTLLSKSLDVRISAGISASEPRLSDEGIDRGLAAVQELLTLAAPYSPVLATLVATSAVRDAVNGNEFRSKILAATGFDVRILTGEQEARAIGRGLISDPALTNLENYYVFDLGGGSLECLAFKDRNMEQAISLQLGCVRLTEKFVADPSAIFTTETRSAIKDHVRTALIASGFRFDLRYAAAVATGGTVTTVRTILGKRAGWTLEQTPALVTVRQLSQLLDGISSLSLTQRQEIPGMPAARADVFPTALVTILALAEIGGFTSFCHSLHNLRYGLAMELLESL